jgi:hypothetical protein
MAVLYDPFRIRGGILEYAQNEPLAKILAARWTFKLYRTMVDKNIALPEFG